MVRCGVAIYGLDPFGRDPRDHGLEPALELISYVADVKRFEPGASAGYGRTWKAAGGTWVAPVPIGYGDGWRRGLSNRASALVGGEKRPIVGTVSMDNITVDLGPETSVAAFDEVVLIGERHGDRHPGRGHRARAGNDQLRGDDRASAARRARVRGRIVSRVGEALGRAPGVAQRV